MRVIRVPADQAGMRLDLFLARALGASRARVRRAILEGAIEVDGRRAKKGETLRAGARLSVETDLSEEALHPVREPDIALTVLYEGQEVVAVDKPAGMPVHPLREGERGTVVNALVARYPEMIGLGDDPREGGLLHRLDTETSGVLLAARTRGAYGRLRGEIRGGKTRKTYLALVHGRPPDRGDIDLPIVHDPKAPSRMRILESAGAERPGVQPAETRFRVLERFRSASLLQVDIRTGARHQIRVHLGHAGFPIAGDTLYGGSPVAGLNRMFLHASRVQVSGLDLQSPLPVALSRVLDRLRRGAGRR